MLAAVATVTEINGLVEPVRGKGARLRIEGDVRVVGAPRARVAASPRRRAIERDFVGIGRRVGRCSRDEGDQMTLAAGRAPTP